MTTFKYKPKTSVEIPSDWTADQAKAVWEFLEEICSVIWDVHDKKLVEAFMDDGSLPEPPKDDNDDPFDDDYPF